MDSAAAAAAAAAAVAPTSTDHEDIHCTKSEVQQAARVVGGAVQNGEETISNAQSVPSCSLHLSGDQVSMATTLHMAGDKMKQASAGSTSKSKMVIHGSTTNVSMLSLLNTLQMQIYRLKFPSNKGSNGEKSKRCA
jgi:hypothetical protein